MSQFTDQYEKKAIIQSKKDVDAFEASGWQIFEGPHQVLVVHALTGRIIRFLNEYQDEKHVWVCHPVNREIAINLILEWSDR